MHSIDKIIDKVLAEKKLTKEEELVLEEWENIHTDNEFTLTIGLMRDMFDDERAKIIQDLTETVRSWGYKNVEVF